MEEHVAKHVCYPGFNPHNHTTTETKTKKNQCFLLFCDFCFLPQSSSPGSGVVPEPLFMYEYLACGFICVYYMCICCQWRLEKGIGSPGTGEIDGCELPYGC